jgi:polyisoprenoid-binding protein YceI
MIARLCCLLLLLWFRTAAAASRTFAVDSSASSARAHVGKTGIGSFAGHEHEIVARSMQGEVVADFEDLSRSSVDVTVNARALVVSEEGEPAGDAPKVQQAMRGPSVLYAARFPAIHFRSRQIAGKRVSSGSYELTIAGDLSLRGAVKALEMPLQVELRGDTLIGTGKMVVKQSNFGIKPTMAAGGLVQVQDDVTVTFRILARAGGP